MKDEWIEALEKWKDSEIGTGQHSSLRVYQVLGLKRVMRLTHGRSPTPTRLSVELRHEAGKDHGGMLIVAYWSDRQHRYLYSVACTQQ